MRTFAQLFAGRTDCYGIYRVDEVRADGKQKGRGITYPNPRNPHAKLTDEQWTSHLSGKERLGIVPVLPDGTCGWFAIDIDDYSLDFNKLLKAIETRELPLVVCRSKSGGAHIYCFINGKISAELAVKLGRKWAGDLGYSGAEVFPKQTSFSEPGAIGNWINLPYYRADDSDAPALGISGETLSIEEFERFAHAKEISPKEAGEYLTIAAKKPDDILSESPPCIVRLMKDGVGEGGRNNVLSHLCVYYQKIDEFLETNEWKDKILEANKELFDDPLPYDEVNHIIRSHASKQYQYRCNIEPMMGLCDKKACLKRKLGVGEDRSYYGDIAIESITKIDTDPPVWIVKINGKDMKVSTDALLSPRKFRLCVAETLNIIVPQLKQVAHDALIAPIMNAALTIEPAYEITDEGKTLSAFKEWTEHTVFRCKTKEDMLKGLPWYDSDTEAIYFRSEDFRKTYQSKYREIITDRRLWSIMREAGFDRKQLRINHQPHWFWYYPLDEVEPWFKTEIEEKF